MSNTITKITVETIGASYHVVLVNSRLQRLIVGEPKPLQLALTDAHELGDYFAVNVAPFRGEKGIIEPEVRRDTYAEGRVRTREEIIAAHRLRDGSLNFNKVMHYEWSNFKRAASGGFNDKDQLLKWLMPYFMSFAGDEEARASVYEWLKGNCKDAWIWAKGGVSFSEDRDAALFKVFHHGN